MSGSSWLCSVYCVVRCSRIDHGATYYACYITQAVSGRTRIRTLMWLGIHIEPEAHTGATDNAFVHKCHVFSWFWVLEYWRNSGVPGPLRDAISLPPATGHLLLFFLTLVWNPLCCRNSPSQSDRSRRWDGRPEGSFLWSSIWLYLI